MQCMMGSSHSGDSRLVFVFIRQHPPARLPPLGSCLKRDLVPNIPPPLFTHPSETNRLEGSRPFQGFHSPSRRNSGTDKQPRDNPTEFFLSSLAPLPVCRRVHTGKNTIRSAFQAFMLCTSVETTLHDHRFLINKLLLSTGAESAGRPIRARSCDTAWPLGSELQRKYWFTGLVWY